MSMPSNILYVLNLFWLLRCAARRFSISTVVFTENFNTTGRFSADDQGLVRHERVVIPLIGKANTRIGTDKQCSSDCSRP